MLTTDDSNRLDAITTVTSVLSLLGDLISSRAPGAGLSLSAQSVDGLADVMTLARDTLEESAFGLAKAHDERGDLAAAADNNYRQGYAQGFAAGSDAPPTGDDDSYVAGVRMGARGVYQWAWKDALGTFDGLRPDWRDEMVGAMVEAALERQTARHAEPALSTEDSILPRTPPVPDLTEPLPEEESGGRAISA